MGTETKFKNAPTLNANLMNLPMMKNYSQSEIVTKVDTFRKGEKNLLVSKISNSNWCRLPIMGLYITTSVSNAWLDNNSFYWYIFNFLVVAAPAIFAWVRTLASFTCKCY
jgi:hypothetical protein